MPLQLILGGGQETRSRCVREMLLASAERFPKKRHILLVPAQFTLQTQRDIVQAHSRHSVMNIDVLSFERLAYRVIGEAGGGELTILSEMGKSMLLRKAAGAHREELTLYRRSMRRPGFISRLKSMLSEFYQYGITESDLEEAEKEVSGHPLLAQKLADLRILFRAVNETRGKDTIAAEELLSVLDRKLAEGEYLKDSLIYMDYFTGFTPVQLSVIRKIMCRAESLCVSLFLPEEEDTSEEIRPSDLFYLSRSTCLCLTKMAGECGQSVSRRYVTFEEKGGKPADLAFLGRNFLRYGSLETFADRPESICVSVSANPGKETSAAARHIASLVRSGHLRCREIAVAVGDLEEYRPSLTAAFARENIPCYIDSRKGVMGNPLVEYLRSSLEVLDRDFSYESVFRHLKCGLRILPAEDLDELDAFVYAAGIRGRRRWKEEWTRNPDFRRPADLSKINAMREKVLEDLEPLLMLGQEGNVPAVSERTAALRAMADRIDAAEKMKELAEICQEEGRGDLSEEYRKIGSFLSGFFTEMDSLMGEEKISRREFLDILDAGLAEARLGMLPAGLDLVQIGDVRRSRMTSVKVLFILGMNDGLIPQDPASSGILSEWEREILCGSHMELAPTAENASCQDRFYLYTLMTKPSRKLYLSLSRTGNDGTARRASYLLNQVMRLFPAMEPVDADRVDFRASVTGYSSAWQAFAEHIRDENAKDQGDFRELARTLARQDETGRERMEHLLEKSLRVYEGSRIPEELAEKIYGRDLTGSITRLEQFAVCPAAHFFSYGLRLKPWTEPVMNQADQGNFFHKVLECFFRLLKREQADRKHLTEKQQTELVKRAVAMAWEEENLSLRKEENAGNRYLGSRMEKTAGRTIWALCRQLADSDYEPEDFELVFQGWTSPALQLELTERNRMILSGKVDRVDVYDTEDRRYVRVMDYKSGEKNFDLNEIWQGLSLQLAVYLDAVEELQRRRFPDREILPGGMYYYSVQDPMVEMDAGTGTDDRDTQILKKMQPKGLSNAAGELEGHREDSKGKTAATGQFRALSGRVRQIMTEYGLEILQGRADELPYQRKDRHGCDYCRYRGVCGFDLRVDGYRFRRIEELSEKEVLEELSKQAEERKEGSRS